jgi:GH25 family lysozyme M1 (1,4-beta-N-acetylmuramidase)
LSNQNQPYGVDISKYQFSADGRIKINFDVLNPLIKFCGIRAAISWGYADPWFAYSWANIIAPRIAYHVTYMGENAIRQMDHFLQVVNPGEYDRLALDLELDNGFSKYQITQTVNACLECLKSETGRYPILYSRASWVNAFLQVSDLPEGLDWWLATYLSRLPEPAYTPEHPGPPWLPAGVNNWLIHQTGDRGNGAAHGVASHYIDTNRWNGTEDQMLAYFGLPEESHEVYLPIISTPEPEPEHEKPLYKAEVKEIAPVRLKVRPEPGSSKVVRSLAAGAQVNVYEEKDGWARIGVGEWFTARYLQKMSEKDDRNLLPVPLWSQRDPRWEWLKMGNSGITLGEQGCLVTDTSACLSLLLGRKVTPLEYGQLLNARGGYAPNGDGSPSNRMYWQMPPKYYGTPLICYKSFPSGGGWESTVQGLLGQGLPAMGRVDMLPGAGYLQHWVTFLGEIDNVFWIHDPWYGTVSALKARYPHVFHISAYGRPK